MTRRETVIVGTALLGAAMTIVAARVLIDSSAALRAGEEAAARGSGYEATRHYLEAAQLYLPGSPFVRDARVRLVETADAAERAGDIELARRALESLRAASLGTRSFFTPSADQLAEVDRRLALLDARAEAPTESAPAADRVAWYRERLSRRPGPSLPLSLLALAGFGLWLGAAGAFIARGLDADLKLQRRAALACSAVFVVGFTLFLVGLRLA